MNNRKIDDTKPIVYIIDDDMLVRRAIQRLLRSAGIEAETFATTNEFMESGFRDQNSCLIVDVRMPDLTGLDLQQMMKAKGYNIPLIFITGYDTKEVRETVKKRGAVGYFSKPIDDQALLDTIKWALNI